ncbi:MAG: Fe-Mn family superoxide dismutase [bacterium]|nr:Fe-Mn family superoxide dismutase [bacterium]
MHTYETKKFNLPSLEGISAKSVEEHLGLYAGYVKNFNALSKLIAELATSNWEKYSLAVAELIRRRSFEFDGMRLHEYYFTQFEDGPKPPSAGELSSALLSDYGDGGGFERVMKQIGAMRGPGWVILYYDPEAKELLTSFVGEQHQGHFVTLPIILALDVWEHAFILDYGAQGKGKYIEAFFKNLNWDVMEKRFAEVK